MLPQMCRLHWRYGKSMLKSLLYLLYLLKVNEGEFKTKDSFSLQAVADLSKFHVSSETFSSGSENFLVHITNICMHIYVCIEITY